MNSRIFLTGIFIGVFVIAIITISFIFYKIFSINSEQPYIEEVLPTIVEITPEAEMELQETVAVLISAGDIRACENIPVEIYRNTCINNIALNQAVENEDVAYCRLIKSMPALTSQCEQQILFKKSVSSGDVAICEEASDENIVKSCIGTFPLRLAEFSKDITVCDQYTDTVSCRNSFLLKEFIQNPLNFDCASLTLSDEQNDCSALKPLFFQRVPDFAKLTNACQEMKTPTFKQICSSLPVTAMMQEDKLQ